MMDKKKISLLIIALSCVLNNFSQNYIGYHKSIKKAKVLFIQDKITESLELFEKTFNEFIFNFGEDIYLAAQISATENRKNFTFTFLEKNLKGGLDVNSIEKDTIFRNYTDSKDWLKLKKNDSLYKKKYYSKIDTTLYSKGSFLMKEDQKNVKITYKILYRFFPKLGNKKYMRKNQWVRDSTLKLISSTGYFGAKSTGLNTEKFNSIQNLSSHNIASIIYHFNSLEIENIKPILRKALEDGEIHPRHYAMIYDFYLKSLIFENKVKKNKITFPYRYRFNSNRKDEKWEVINKNRNEIGILSNKNQAKFIFKCKKKGIYPFTNPYN